MIYKIWSKEIISLTFKKKKLEKTKYRTLEKSHAIAEGEEQVSFSPFIVLYFRINE